MEAPAAELAEVRVDILVEIPVEAPVDAPVEAPMEAPAEAPTDCEDVGALCAVVAVVVPDAFGLAAAFGPFAGEV